jgi:hypothetical protein
MIFSPTFIIFPMTEKSYASSAWMQSVGFSHSLNLLHVPKLGGLFRSIKNWDKIGTMVT